MDNLNWEAIKIEKGNYKLAIPFVSIGIGTGRIAISSNACKLIPSVHKYKYIEPLQAKDKDGRVVYLGLSFTDKPSSTVLCVKRFKSKGNPSGGCQIASKQLVRKLFGEVTRPRTEQFHVEKYSNNILAVSLRKPIESRLSNDTLEKPSKAF